MFRFPIATDDALPLYTKKDLQAETIPDHQDGNANPNSVADLPVKAPSDSDINTTAGMKNENTVENGNGTQQKRLLPQQVRHY